MVEPDKGGETLCEALLDSCMADKIHLIAMSPDLKDVSALHIDDPDRFEVRFNELVNSARPLSEQLDAEREQEKAEAWATCERLAHQPNILDDFEGMIQENGLVGETSNAKIINLATK